MRDWIAITISIVSLLVSGTIAAWTLIENRRRNRADEAARVASNQAVLAIGGAECVPGTGAVWVVQVALDNIGSVQAVDVSVGLRLPSAVVEGLGVRRALDVRSHMLVVFHVPAHEFVAQHQVDTEPAFSLPTGTAVEVAFSDRTGKRSVSLPLDRVLTS